MIENVRKYPRATIIALAIYYAVGVFGLSMETTFSLFRALVPFTLLCSLYFLWLFHEGTDWKNYLVFFALFVMGYSIEAIGVNTGVIFGSYTYGTTLGFSILGTPLVIGVNWLILIYCSWIVTGLFLQNRWLRYLAGSSFMVLYDLALESVAIRLDMWTWYGNMIPLRNYVAWFLISMIFFIFLDLTVKQVRNKIAAALFIIQFMFFILLNVIFKVF
jgi:uncharacterized membrane protein